MKAERNKTIDFLPEDAPEYLARCLRVTEDVPLDTVCGRTICGDTFQVAPHLPRGFADLLIVDPPYNLTKDFSGGGFRRTTDANYAAFTRAWIELLLPLLKPDASVYVCCDWRSSPVIGMTLKDYFRLQNRITWQREKGRGAQRNWKNGMEDIWFATRTDDYTFHVDAVKVRRRVRAPYRADGRPKDWEETPDGKFRNTCPSNFWDDISVPYWSMPENTAHPTQKPEKLLAKLILASSDPGGIVLDPFAGSGSTAVTAKKLGRRFVAIERSEQYCAWAEKRLELEVPPDTAEKCLLAAMAPMGAMATGRRSILLTSRQMSAAAVLDTLTMLKSAQETLLAALEQACGSCDSLCEDYARSDENAEAVLQTIPAELLARLRKRNLCLRQLARHLVRGDIVYEA